MAEPLLRGAQRLRTKCEKWDDNPSGALPMWVADMDFACAQPILDALCARLAHPVLGYTFMDDEDYNAVTGFYARRHGLSLTAEQLLFTTGVVKSLLLGVQALTQPGDGILIQTPLYGPFSRVIRTSGRTVVENPLVEINGRYEMDFDDLDAKLAGCKLFLFCSPHNPTGRVWTHEELSRVLELCKKHGTTLVADEIHCDFAFARPFTPILSIPGAQEGIASAVSATKSFNIAGLNHSTLIVPDPVLRKTLRTRASYMGMDAGNLLGIAATTAAYTRCDDWLDAVSKVILRNREGALSMLQSLGLPANANEGTYLMWLDLRKYGLKCEALSDLLIRRGNVRLSLGTEFGARGEGFMRLNMAAPTELFDDGLARIRKALI